MQLKITFFKQSSCSTFRHLPFFCIISAITLVLANGLATFACHAFVKAIQSITVTQECHSSLMTQPFTCCPYICVDQYSLNMCHSAIEEGIMFTNMVQRQPLPTQPQSQNNEYHKGVNQPPMPQVCPAIPYMVYSIGISLYIINGHDIKQQNIGECL